MAHAPQQDRPFDDPASGAASRSWCPQVRSRLKEIADELTLEASRVNHWIGRMNTDSGARAMARAVADLNAALEPHIPEIARITGNNEGTLRMAYAPPAGDAHRQWFSQVSATEFLRGVAEYESFNLKAWREKGWTGWGKHPELVDPPPRSVAPDVRPEVEVFHWNMSEQLERKPLQAHMQDVVMTLMRGDAEGLHNILADAKFWAEQGVTWRKVADVSTTDFDAAFDLTNHIDSDWTLNDGVRRSGATWPNDPARSTSVGDIMRLGDRVEVVSSFGFTTLSPQSSAWLDHACALDKPLHKALRP